MWSLLWGGRKSRWSIAHGRGVSPRSPSSRQVVWPVTNNQVQDTKTIGIMVRCRLYNMELGVYAVWLLILLGMVSVFGCSRTSDGNQA